MDRIRSRQVAGITLLEVLVATAVFSIMMVAMMAIYKVSLADRDKVVAHSDTYRAMMITLDRIRDQLRGASLTAPSAVGTQTASISYLYPMVIDGEMQVDGSGRPVWAGAARLSLDAQGRLVKVDSADPGVTQVLARLGPASSIEFELVARDLLQVRVHVERGRRIDAPRWSQQDMTLHLFLPN